MKIKPNLKCEKCGWSWNYTGKKTYTATCPDCGHKVKLKKAKKGEDKKWD